MNRLLMLGVGAALALFGCDDGEPGGAGGAGGAIEADGTVGGTGGGGAGGGVVPDMGSTADPCETNDDCGANQWCDFDPVAFEGECKPGCRLTGESGCEDRFICDEDRRCVPDPHCIADTECGPEAYCLDGDCLEGCRLPPNDACPPTAEGASQACNPATRACELLVPCCDDGCSFTLADTCQDRPNEAFARCVNPNPCEGRCDRDSRCSDEQYCGENGLCTDGCRLDEVTACPGQVCDAEARRCVPIHCESDDLCPEDQYCDLPTQGCRFGCRTTPDSCNRGLFCNAARQCGQGCRNDDQCIERNGQGWYCNDAAECEGPCNADSDCVDPDHRCDVDSGECTPGCRDDGMEPNNERESALALDFGQADIYQAEALRACEQDGDWYRFDTPAAGWRARVLISFSHADGDIDAQLFPPADAAPIRAQSGDDNEVLEGEGAAGSWHLYVYARGFDRADYTLRVELMPPEGGCQADLGEAGDADNAAATASYVSLPNLRSQEALDRTVCAGDVDWFAVDLGDQDGFSARVEMLGNGMPGGGELDLEVYGPGEPNVGDAPTFLPNVAGGGVNGPRYIEFNAPRLSQQVAAGRYYVKVNGLDAEQWGNYRMRLAVDRARALCVADDTEPNDQQVQATDLLSYDDITERQPGVGVVLRDGEDLLVEARWLCAEGEDWYSFRAARGDDMVATVRRHDMPLAGDVIVEIRDENGVIGQPGRSAQANNTARADDLRAGMHYVRVATAVAETQTNYDLQLNRTAALMACNPDIFDEAGSNDARATATQINPPGVQALTLCGRDGDVDWYYFDTPSVGDIDVRLQFSHASANLELDVFDGDAAVSENAALIDGHTVTNDEAVLLRQRLPGRYYVRVSAVGDADGSYNLTLVHTPRIFACVDDPDEPNERFADATELGNGSFERRTQWLCDRLPAEADTFSVIVPAGRQRTYAATFTYGDDGDLALEAFDSDEMMRVTTSDIPRGNSKQCLVIDAAPMERQFFVRVVPLSINRVIQDDEKLAYRLQVVDGDACEQIAPAAPGVNWPHVAP
jgi:hypothetical protein